MQRRRSAALWIVAGAVITVAAVLAIWPLGTLEDELAAEPARAALAGQPAIEPPDDALEHPSPAPVVAAEGEEAPEPETVVSPTQAVVYTGRLVDSRGEPLSGAHVWLVPDSATLRARDLAGGGPDDDHPIPTPPLSELDSTTSDPEGRFRIGTDLTRARARTPGAAAATARAPRPFPELIARRTGLQPARHVCVEPCEDDSSAAPSAAAPIDVGVLTLLSGVSIEGRVVDDHQQPLAGVDVSARAPGPAASGSQSQSGLEDPARALACVSSAADGRFQLDGLGESTDQPIRVRFDVACRDAVQRELFASVGEGVQLGDVLISRGLAIDGRVIDEAGRPLADVPVRLTDEVVEGWDPSLHTIDIALLMIDQDDEVVGALGSRSARYSETLSGPDGRFEIGGLDGQTEYAAYARAPGREPARATRLVGGSSGIELRLAARGQLELSLVEYRTGKPLADATVRAFRRMFGFPNPLESAEMPVERAGEPGHFIVSEVCPAEVGVLIDSPSAGRHALITQGLALGAAPAQRVLTVQPGATLAGVIVEETSGAPLSGIMLALWADNREAGGALLTPRHLVTGDAGTFRFEGLTPGNWSLAATGADAMPAWQSVVLTAGETRADLRLAMRCAGRVAGQVRTASGGEAPDVDVMVKESAGASMVYASAQTGPDGRYLLQAPPGAWTIQFDQNVSGGWNSAFAQATIVARELTTVDATLPPLARLSGLALSVGKPVPKASISVRGRRVEMRIEADDEGRFEQDVVGVGELTLVGRSQRGGISEPCHVLVEPGGSAWAEVRFGGRTLTGLVLDATSGAPIVQAAVVVEAAGKLKVPESARIVTDAEGRVSFDDMSVGEYRVAASHPDFRKAERQALSIAAADLAPSVTLKLSRANALTGVVRTEDGTPVATPQLVTAFRMLGHGQGTGVTSSDGSYRIVDLPAGLYEVFVTQRLDPHAELEPDDYERLARGSAMVEIEADTDARLDIELKAPGD